MCSYTSSLMSRTLVGAKMSCNRRMSASLHTVPLGLCGLLMMIARVRSVMAEAMASKLGRKLPGTKGTRTTRPPASSMLGT